MLGRLAAVVLPLFFILGLAFAAPGPAQARTATDAAVDIVGNHRVDAALIRSHFHAGRDGTFDPAALDAALKSLYATGLFQDVKIARDGGRVIVTVSENPTLDKVAFEGNKKVKDDDLTKAIQSKAGGPLSRAMVHDDVEQIIELYRTRGYFAVQVVPKTINAKNDAKNNTKDNIKNNVKNNAKNERVSLVFEIKEGDKLAVRQIQFAGNDAYPANKLRGVIKSGATNLLTFLLDNDIYDADRIDGDIDLIRRFYLAHGYADVRVRAASSYEAEQKGVVLTFTIDEGQPYRLGRVDVASSLPAVDPGALRAYLRTQPGDVYDADAANKTVEALTMALAQSGKPFATVIARPERVADRRLINLVYSVEAGKRLYVERIDIRGNGKTHDEVIRREFDLVEGDAYNRALLDRAERRLKALGYFKTVKITTQAGSAPDRVVVDVELEEQKTGFFWITGGYSTADGAEATVTVGDTDFMGTGDIVKLTTTIGQYGRGADFSFTDPYALGPRLSLGVDLFGKETLASSYQSFDSTFYGAKFSAGTPLTDNLGVTWNYSIYNQSLTLDPAVGTASLPIQQAAAQGPMWVSSVGSTVTYSTLDNLKSPTNGVRVVTSNDFAGLGGAAKFARTTEDVRYYHEIVGDVVGMVRAQGGYVTPWGGQQLPLLDGFFGGPQLVRGFAPNGFGPRDITPGTTQDNIGGNVYWTTSAELQAPMPLVSPDAQLKVALFSDVGSLWATNASSATSLASLSPSQQIANSHAIRASVGGSLIWDSPFGALRVDYAYPVAHQPYDVTQRLGFSAGAF